MGIVTYAEKKRINANVVDALNFVEENSIMEQKQKSGGIIAFIILVLVAMMFLANRAKMRDNEPALKGTLEETDIYNDNGITVKILGLSNGELKYNVINKSEQDIVFWMTDVAVNNCVIYPNEYTRYVTAGNKEVANVNLSCCKEYGIDEIKTLDFIFLITKPGGSAGSSIESSACIKTSQYDGTLFEPSFSGKQIYEDEYIDIQAIRTGNGLKEYNILVHNKTQLPISAYFDSLAANGIMVDNYSFLGGTVFAEGYAYSGAYTDEYITLYSAFDEEVKEKGFDNLYKFTGNLNVSLDSINNSMISYTVKSVDMLGE